MEITCFKREGVRPSLFFVLNTPRKTTFLASKTAKKYQNVDQMLPKSGFKSKEKTLTTLFLSH